MKHCLLAIAASVLLALSSADVPDCENPRVNSRGRMPAASFTLPLVPEESTVLNLDVRQTGLGGASCGPAPLEKYRYKASEPIKWTLRIEGIARTGYADVDPMIGTEGKGSEYGGMMPMAGVPFGSMNLVPVTRTNGVSRTSFNALDGNLLGFILTRQPAIWMGDWGPVRIWLPEPLPIEDIEARPHLVKVKAGGMTYELTASANVACIRSDDPFLARALPGRGSTTERTQRTSTQPIPGFKCHFASVHSDRTLKVAVSLIEPEEAEKSLRGTGGFDDVAAFSRSEWERYFSRVSIDAPKDVKKIFYTGLYRTLLYPREITERGRYYSAMDDSVHEGTSYTCFSLWDTYRAQHPLLTLIAPDRVDGMMQSLVNMYREGGWLPLWSNPGYTGQMIGGPAEVTLAEAYVKGFRGFDVKGAWEAVLKNATVPQVGDLDRRWPGTLHDPPGPPETRAGLTSYMKNGYVAADKTNESVSRTLDYALDDNAVADFASALGRKKEERFFRARAKSYTNLWNSAAGGFLPRDTAGEWIDPSTLTYRNKAYTETDPQTARWCVPHDVAGLVELMGGKDVFVRELDAFFDKGFFRKDAVGNKSVHGNETAHHVAYMYNRVGEYDRTCRRVRAILRRCYSADRRGFDGNEDCGQMSAWYVFSALGFYPLDPSSGEYELGSPLVRSATLRFSAPYGRAELRIETKNHSPERWRVRRVTLNGRELADRRIRHSDIVKGGTLVFEMAD